MTVLVEACVDSIESARQAEAAGAGRLELCVNLSVGGTTPDLEMLAELRRHVAIPLHVMIRPRGGDFVYAPNELAGMLRDIATAAERGADGLVFGALDRESRVDSSLTRQLIEAARPLPVTFHRAFDRTPDPAAALDALSELGVERVLTAGQAVTAEDGIPVLAELVRRAARSLRVLAGGRIRPHNAARIVRDTGVTEIHLRAGPGGAWVRGVVEAVSGER